MQARDGEWTLSEILETCEWDDQAIAVSAGHGLSNHSYVEISESSKKSVILGSRVKKLQNMACLKQKFGILFNRKEMPR